MFQLTHRRLYKYKRLPYGVVSTPAIFQKLMESVLQDIPNVVIYIDDILIMGKSESENLANLASVFDQLQQSGLRITTTKCSFMQVSAEYLGHY